VTLTHGSAATKRASTLRLGAAYPTTELSGDVSALRDFARAIEDAELRHLTLYDHVLSVVHEDRSPPLRGSYTERHPFHEPLTALTYIAARQERLELATGVLILPQRQTAIVAKQATELMNLSGGRLRLGVGTGWNHVEYGGLGQDFASRGQRLDEQLELLRLLWAQPVVDFEGRFDRIDRAGINPLPVAPPPIWVGGFSPPAWRRAARWGDGHIFVGGARDSPSAPEQWNSVQELVQAEGRDLEQFGADLYVRMGDPAAAADEILDWESRGGTHATIITMDRGFTSIGEHIDFVCDVKARVGS
jgi:probable F420-dependent oxidoreductase